MNGRGAADIAACIAGHVRARTEPRGTAGAPSALARSIHRPAKARACQPDPVLAISVRQDAPVDACWSVVPSGSRAMGSSKS